MQFLQAMTAPILTGLVLYPPYIRLMQRLSWGQEIRPEGPEDHVSKRGTPTMGGAVLLLSFLTVLLWTGWGSVTLWVFLLFVLANGALGFTDDITQVTKKRSLGLKARQKLLAQFIMGALLASYATTGPNASGLLWLPGAGWIHAPLLVFVLAVLVTTGASNAVNLTDGLDGLAGGTVAVASFAYIPICLANDQPQLALAATAMVGACCGFLWFNCFPARIFMGDTGSLALGAALGAMAVLTHTEFLLVVIGGVFVMEAMSVILQVSYFKATGGKRIFRMSPIHHHFCKGGLHEVQVTTRFWILAAVLAVLGMWTYFHCQASGPWALSL